MTVMKINPWRGITSSLPRLISQIEGEAKKYLGRTDAELRQSCRNLRFEAMAGANLKQLLVPSFGLAFATIEKKTGLRPYHTQIRAAVELCRPCIVEMATGEGKTLTALMPVFLKALYGKGVYFATSNDYLASRDADHARQVYQDLGITVGCIKSESDDQARRTAYQCDITYGTTSEFGFDFLRDRAKAKFNQDHGPSAETQEVGRGELHTIIVDEADGLLIDEAATPMVISSVPKPLSDAKSELFRWAHQTALLAEPTAHYRKNTIKDKIELTERGREWTRQMARSLPLERRSILDLFEYVERAILMHTEYIRDKRFVIQDNQVVIVDENTGRLGVGREWSDGIQQAIQAKEGLEVTGESGHLAKVSVQNFIKSFKHCSGMTGTAIQSTREFRKTYKLPVKPIPTFRKSLRIKLPTHAYLHQREAFEFLVGEIRTLIRLGRPVLIGTRTIQISEQLSEKLHEERVSHTLLNAKNDQSEADIISRAGVAGRVTIATNMAGRGTDIKLDELAKNSGGLHVFVLGIHNSKRIDRQLIGRCARQGDPGSYRIVLFLTDDFLDFAWGPEIAQRSRDQIRSANPAAGIVALFESAQRTITTRMESNRAEMLHHERKSIKQLSNAGLDPVLDIPS